MYQGLAILAVFAFLYSTVAGRLERTPISGPMVFTFVGILIGPLVLGWLEGNVTGEELRILADLTLALVLFIDASNANLRELKRSSHIPKRMLLIGLPSVILLGLGIALLLFEQLSFFEAAILATTLAATDAALGKAVVTNKSVPADVREGLNVESGLNDGLCVPILFVFIALALETDAGESSTALALRLVAEELGIGLIVGLGMTWVGGLIVMFCDRRKWITETWGQLLVITLAIGCFAVAQSLHGSGYIAAFTGGLLFGFLAKEETHELVLAAEGVGEIFAMITWVVFGTAVIGQVLGEFDWNVVLYAVLSLTVIRMVPMFLSLTGSGQSTQGQAVPVLVRATGAGQHRVRSHRDQRGRTRWQVHRADRRLHGVPQRDCPRGDREPARCRVRGQGPACWQIRGRGGAVIEIPCTTEIGA